MFTSKWWLSANGPKWKLGTSVNLLKLVNSTKADFLFAGEIRAQMFWKKHQTNAHFLNDAFKNKEH